MKKRQRNRILPILIVTVLILSAAALTIFVLLPVLRSSGGWNIREVTRTRSGAFTFYSVTNTKTKNAWIYKIEVAREKDAASLNIPEKIGENTVTRLGWSKEIEGDDPRHTIDYKKNIFDATVASSKNIDGGKEETDAIMELSIPNSVTRIDPAAFSGMNELGAASLPSGLTYLREKTFYGCDSLTSVTLPEKMNTFTSSAFLACPSLSEVRLTSRNKTYKVKDGFIINKKKKALLWVVSGKKNANIPSGVKTVNRRAFTNSTATSVRIPKTVKTIEKDGLTSIYLKNVTVSKKSKYLAKKGQCVYDKKRHALVVAVTRKDGTLCIADKVRRLKPDNSIAGHDVDTLIIPSSVRSSAGTGFNLERLGLMDEVYFLGKKPPKIVKAAPAGYHSLPVLCKVYVPKGCKKIYEKWYIKNKCFDDLKSLTEMSDKKQTELTRTAASNTVKEPSKKKAKADRPDAGTNPAASGAGSSAGNGSSSGSGTGTGPDTVTG
jgi:hypothetical protein